MSRRAAAAALLALLAAGPLEAARPARKSDVAGGSTLDKFNEQFSHLHVRPSTHRSVRRRDGEVPTLVVTFALHAAARTLLFVMPPGYEPVIDPVLPTNCGIFAPAERANFSVYSRATGALPLTPHITECAIKPAEKGKKVEIVLHICKGIPGLSFQKPMEADGKAASLTWWFFHVQAWIPDASPPKEDNTFKLHWAEARGGMWAGSTEQKGDPVLGDWDCLYSDWEGWGACSARCGGGVRKLRRRVLMEPPADGSGMNCTEQLEQTVPCNAHACIWPCEFTEEIRGRCSAECGGGVRMVRMRWHGEHCPDKADTHAIRTEACNTQPCRSKCDHEDQWTVVTPCSEPCGPGFFWLMRSVIRKDINDPSCTPEWRRLPCLKQRCTPLTVVRPDINIHPYPKDVFKAGVFFKVPVLSRVIQLNAPEGFSFGPIGGTCNISSHDLAPHFDYCEVGVRASQAIIKLSTPLPATFPSDYSVDALHPDSHDNGTQKTPEFDDKHSFAIEVFNPGCRNDQWIPDIMVTTFTCGIPSDQNRWVIEFGEDATTRWESLSTEGYPIFSPQGSEEVIKLGKNSRISERQLALAKQAQSAADPTRRPRFCSRRIACKDSGHVCNKNGVCEATEAVK